MSPRETKFCVTYNMLPASYGFTEPALTFVEGILLDGSPFSSIGTATLVGFGLLNYR